MKLETIENIILRSSSRGMEQLCPLLPPEFCAKAASSLLGLRRGNVLIATGFYVEGFAETDGPPGAYFLAKALDALGFHCTVITDKYGRGFFDFPDSGSVAAEYVGIDVDEFELSRILDQYKPVAIISIERCGINANGDYANMRGTSIADHTARLDYLFEEGTRRSIPTFGIGDGGNEIGMGCFKVAIEQELSLTPCVTKVDYPIIAAVSNWGAYGLCAYLQKFSGLPVMPASSEVAEYISHIVKMGSIDGVTGEHAPTVDGFPGETERETVELLLIQAQ